MSHYNNDHPCGKRRYADKKTALTAKNRIFKRGNRHSKPKALRAYHCPRCNGWYLTKKDA